MQLACQRCRRLVAAGCLAERAGQPTQIMLHMGLDQLRDLPGADDAEAAWAGAAAGPGADCDATIVPVVTGHVDPDVLDRLAAALRRGREAKKAQGSQDGPGGKDGQAARQIVIAHAADLLSVPAGWPPACAPACCTARPRRSACRWTLARRLRPSPAHLRRLVIARDRHCRFPGCEQPPAACQPHHIVPRSESGRTSLTNLLLLCTFHHLIAVHRWGWGIVLLPDGTVTATSPDRTRTLRSHSPPAHAA